MSRNLDQTRHIVKQLCSSAPSRNNSALSDRSMRVAAPRCLGTIPNSAVLDLALFVLTYSNRQCSQQLASSANQFGIVALIVASRVRNHRQNAEAP
jgi:hypothetical protein